MADTAPATSLDSYSTVQSLLHYVIGIASVFGAGGSMAVPGIWGIVISVAGGLIGTIGAGALHTISVKSNSKIGEVLAKVDSINAAVTAPSDALPTTPALPESSNG